MFYQRRNHRGTTTKASVSSKEERRPGKKEEIDREVQNFGNAQLE